MTVIIVSPASYAEDLGSADDSIEDAGVVYRDVLFGDDLDHFLRDHAARESRNIMQFSSPSPRYFFGDLRDAFVGGGVRDILFDGGKNIRRTCRWFVGGGTQR